MIAGQLEAERRIVELEARVARLQDELEEQKQKVQAQRQHYDKSLGAMEASYRVLERRVEQDIAGIRAEHARKMEQQAQSLCIAWRKEMAEAIATQLVPVDVELNAL